MFAAVVLAVVQLPAAIAGLSYDSGAIAPGVIPGCTKGIPYYRVIEGQMPPGLSLRAAGRLTGQASGVGEYAMTLEVGNGCAQFVLPVRLSVRGRPFLTAWDTEIELTAEKREALTRVYGDRGGLMYTATASEPWLKVTPLNGRTPLPGEALTADPLTIEVDPAAFEVNPDGGAQAREATIWLTCFRCRATSIQVTVAKGIAPATRSPD